MRAGAVSTNVNVALSSVVLTVRLVGVRRLKARTWIGAQLIRLAVLIMGCKLEMQLDNRAEPGDE